LERELHCLPMIRHMSVPMPDVNLPCGYRIINITEENGYLWESVMEDAYNEVFLPGTFRGVMVSHPFYDDNQVYVMLNEKSKPIATASGWRSPINWHEQLSGSVIHVGVIHSYRGHQLGQQMVYHTLQELKRKGYDTVDLGVEENNFTAIKTYFNCGFIPEAEEPIEVEYWNEQIKALGLPRYEKTICLRHMSEEVLPPRPWPYQLRYYAKAEDDGNNYVYGSWYWHNLFHVTQKHYVQLKELIANSKYSYEIINSIESKSFQNVFVDRPVNPSAVLLERQDGVLYLIGMANDSQFCNGVEEYLLYRCKGKFEKAGMTVTLIDDDFCGMKTNPRIVEGLVYGAPMALPDNGLN